MDAEDVRGEAAAIYDEAREEMCGLPGALKLASLIFGPRLLWVPGLESPGRLVCVANDDGSRRYELHLRKGQPVRVSQWAAAHELGHYRLERGGWTAVVLPWLERAASNVGAEITAPEVYVKRYFTELRWGVESVRPRKMAELFLTTQTVCALRLGEVYGNPTAVVNTATLFDRSDAVVLRGEWGRNKPTLPWLHWATSIKRAPPGWRRVRLGDATNRVMLVRIG